MIDSNDLFASTRVSTSYDSLFYQKQLHEFTETFSAAALAAHRQDPLSSYFLAVMKDEEIRMLTASHQEGPRIFIDTLMAFTTQYLQKENYFRQRQSAEEKEIQEAENWSGLKIRQNWESLLLNMTGKYEVSGFSATFYRQEFEACPHRIDEGLWQHLLQEWQFHFDRRLSFQKQKFIEDRSKMETQLLKNNLKGAITYLRAQQVSTDLFEQTWALMGGHWNNLEFERLMRTTRLQQRYPVLQTITKRMGRFADKNGALRLSTTSGSSEKMEHTSKSDITGVSMGRDLNSLLPSEMAQFLDKDTEDIFMQKYVTRRLQTFEHQSRILNSARSLQRHSASPKGPVVACVDTSGSMKGEPSQIALSLMMRLAEMSEKEKRPCYLIAFSVHARSMDVLFDRTRLLQFFTQNASGSTDAQSMLHTLFELLHSKKQYACADVLWITDFKIPLPPPPFLQEMEKLRKEGTHFYGLQIGGATNHWKRFFDEIFSITDAKMPIL